MTKIIFIILFTAVACNEGTTTQPTNNNNNNNEICNDNIDNDGDGAIDCDDSGCRYNGACTANPTCGNGVLDDDEMCDGAELNGESCETQVVGTTGTLTCNIDCTYNTASCHVNPLGIYASGARIKMRVGRSSVPDGSVSFNGWYDTTLGINCSWRKHSDGSMRCLPELTASQERWYADAGCTVRLAAFPTEDDPLQNGTQISMEMKTGVFGAFVVSGTHSGSVYHTRDGFCSRTTVQGMAPAAWYTTNVSVADYQTQTETFE